LQAETGLPLVLIGGSPRGEAESEAVVVARASGLVWSDSIPKSGIHLETSAMNSAETAASARRILDDLGADHIILVTSPTHIARMAASLRHFGIDVSALPARATQASVSPRDAVSPFVPSGKGFSRSARAAYEYVGIMWYVLTEKITWSDLKFGGPTAQN
jgi:uncharacterized SAM-binding protein YcdF (DUF218 family)